MYEELSNSGSTAQRPSAASSTAEWSGTRTTPWTPWGEAIRVIVDGITVDGTQMADEGEALMWGFTNMLHSQVQRLDRAVDRIAPEMKDLEKAQDGSEVKAWELQTMTDRAQNLGDRRDAFEKMRDLAADAYRVETGDTWRPRHGSHTSQTGTLTSAAIDARDFRRARKDRETRAHLPEGTLVAITGGKTVSDADAVWSTLDMAHAKYGDMVLLHGGGPGVEKIAASWADARGVNQIVCRPDWNAHGEGRALPPQRRAAQPAAQGRHRVPRLRHHRQPRRQSPHAGNPSYAGGRVTATPPLPPRAGRCLGGGRLPLFRRAPPPRFAARRIRACAARARTGNPPRSGLVIAALTVRAIGLVTMTTMARQRGPPPSPCRLPSAASYPLAIAIRLAGDGFAVDRLAHHPAHSGQSLRRHRCGRDRRHHREPNAARA